MYERQRDDPEVLVPELEPTLYRAMHPDLADLSADQLTDHYWQFGRHEGRSANSLPDRRAFAQMAARASVLELGPFANPLINHHHARYADVLSTDELRSRAAELGLDVTGVPHIDWVVRPGELSSIPSRFESVLSSHVTEHQPDLIGHLQQVGNLLAPGGCYFLILPDHRYCFDHFQVPSTLAKALDRHYSRAAVHALESVIEHRAMTTHNDATRHWQGDHGSISEGFLDRVRSAIEEYEAARSAYVDVHAWYFTPDSWRSLVTSLRELRMIPFEVARVYPTRWGQNEFWTVLKCVE